MRNPMLAASDDATSGSVIENAERISPSSSGASHCCLTCSLPYRLRISMLPVSGAEQLSTSEANTDLAELLGDRRIVEVRQLRARSVGREVGQEQVPQARAHVPPP